MNKTFLVLVLLLLKMMDYQSIKEECEIIGISFENIENIKVRDVIHAYRKRAIKVHPDKVPENLKEKAKSDFQILNHSYEKLLKFFVEKTKEDRKNEVVETGEVSEEELFMEENFKNFNFPTENDGSFTVNIQHSQADAWQESLERIYGEPIVHKRGRGTVGDTFWQFKYFAEERETTITLHIYNKPKNKKTSKLLIQSGCQSLVCIYVFSELPRIFKTVCTKTAIMEDKGQNMSLVKCGQCKVKASLARMKMHLKKVHGTAKYKKKTEEVTTIKAISVNTEEFHCRNSECNYKTNSQLVLNQHIDAIHLIPWKLRARTIACKKCGAQIKEGEMNNHMKSEHEEIIANTEIIDIEYHEDLNNSESRVEERDCPTPLPEQVFICGECNTGITNEADVEMHMRIYHAQERPLDDRIKYLEAALRAEQEQHKHHVDTLENTLKEISKCEQRIKELENVKKSQDVEIDRLKKRAR